MSKLSALLESAAVLGGMTTIYIEVVGDFTLKDITVTATGIVTLFIALVRAAIWWRAWREGKKRKSSADL